MEGRYWKTEGGEASGKLKLLCTLQRCCIISSHPFVFPFCLISRLEHADRLSGRHRCVARPARGLVYSRLEDRETGFVIGRLDACRKRRRIQHSELPEIFQPRVRLVSVVWSLDT